MKKFLVLGMFVAVGTLLGSGCVYSDHHGHMKCCDMSMAHEKHEGASANEHEKHGADAAKSAEGSCCKKMSEGAGGCCKKEEKAKS